MSTVNPPFALQNAGATHTAENDRMMISSTIAGLRTSGSLISRGGVAFAGGQLKVQAQGSPAMAVDVLSGHIYVPGSEGAKQGTYSCTNDGTVALSITTAHATLPRIDIVVAKVEDQAYSGANNLWSLAVVAGTPAASPVAPTAPNNSLTLAQILVGAGVTSIVNGNITDTRIYVAAEGGVIPCTSTQRPAVTVVPTSQLIYETDTNRFWYLRSGAFWPLGPLIAYKTAQETLASSITLQNDDHLLMPLDINATYLFKLYLIFTSGSTVDFKFDITVPAGTAFPPVNAVSIETWPSATNNLIAVTPSTTQNLDGGNASTPTIVWGSFATGGTAGNFQFRWAQQVSSAAANAVEKGSWLEIVRVA